MMRKGMAIFVLILFPVCGFAAGVNDVLPNGQHTLQFPQPLNPNVAPATPNRSGAYYTDRQLYPRPVPHVRGARVREYRR
jgi:hypothetical protein